MNFFKVVLVEPEIPSNTGNIGRTCVITNSELHLVGPLGFEITDKRLKRAGLDYWPHLKWFYHDDWESWMQSQSASGRTWFFSTKGQTSIYDTHFKAGDIFVFGQETKGLKSSVLSQFEKQVLTIPMLGPARSLNLANSVAVSLYEALRQTQSFSKKEKA